LREYDIVSAYGRFGLKPKEGESLSEEVYPLGNGDMTSVGSTDVRTVSWVVPTAQCRVARYAVGTPAHSWQVVARGQALGAAQGPHLCGLALTRRRRALGDEAQLKRTKAEHREFWAKNPFPDRRRYGAAPRHGGALRP
jgi:aminobenzoyl-glutamate utilization protein B